MSCKGVGNDDNDDDDMKIMNIGGTWASSCAGSLERERDRELFNANAARVWAYGGWCRPACRLIYRAGSKYGPMEAILPIIHVGTWCLTRYTIRLFKIYTIRLFKILSKQNPQRQPQLRLSRSSGCLLFRRLSCFYQTAPSLVPILQKSARFQTIRELLIGWAVFF